MNDRSEGEAAETQEARDARLLLGATKMIVRAIFVTLGVLGAIAAPIMVNLMPPEQIEKMPWWVLGTLGLCVAVYFYLELRWWWMKEYRDGRLNGSEGRKDGEQK